MTTHNNLDAFTTKLTERINAGEMPVEGQEKKQPKFWLEVARGGAGWFAVLLWDGMGFPEPYETGAGRYSDRESAIAEARGWALAEELEFKES